MQTHPPSNEISNQISKGGVRFAPSPTGRFHLGNLRTAWISHEFARAKNLPWVVRMEDIDKPRVLSWAAQAQLDDLRELGLNPDYLVVQSDLADRHWEMFRLAVLAGQVYPCDCSRKDVRAAIASAPHNGEILYSGLCRALSSKRELRAAESIAWRFRMPLESGAEDFIAARSGPLVRDLPQRESFVPAYHWACAIDDFDGGYDLLVRSIDLLPAAPLQNAIHGWLASLQSSSVFLPIPLFHTSLVTDASGRRLEKRTPGVTLQELRSRSTVEEILSKVRASFDVKYLVGAHTKEERASITTRDIGLD